MIKRFEVSLLEDAVAFLDSIDGKAREKIIYNLSKAEVSNNKELFKKLNNEIWEFRTIHRRS